MRTAAALTGALVFFGATGWAAAQTCTGDCDGRQSVSVAELVLGVNISLGRESVLRCSSFDRSGDSRVAIDELVEGVSNFVTGCPAQRSARASSSIALSSVRTVLNFGSVGPAGGGGGAALAAPWIGARAALQGGGQGLGCGAPVSCPLGGTEQLCCFFDEFEFLVAEITDDQCSFPDNSGNTVTLDGFAALTSTDPEVPFDPCSTLAPVYGVGFFLRFSNYTTLVRDGFGNFDVTISNSTEDFIGFGSSCPQQFDPFSLGLRGDGIRTLDGSVQRVIGDASGPFFDSTAFAEELDLDVVLSFGGSGCVITTTIDGGLDAADAIAGVESSQTFDAFDVIETPAGGGDFFVDYFGFVSTDCAGDVSVSTLQSLELPFGAVCPTGGRILIEGEQATTAVAYSGGAVSFDVGADGSIEEFRSSCTDLGLRECGMRQEGRTCAPCSTDGECGAGFECGDCLFCDVFDRRCVPEGEFELCGENLYGNLIIDIEL